MAESVTKMMSGIKIADDSIPEGDKSNQSSGFHASNESSEFEEMIPERCSSEMTVFSELDAQEDRNLQKRTQIGAGDSRRSSRLMSTFAELDTSDDEAGGERASLPPAKQGLLPFSGASNRAKVWSSQSTRTNGTYSALGVRREQTRIESLESENFQLKLKISNMERDSRGAGDSASTNQLTELREECERHKARALEMEGRVDKLLIQRRREYDEDIKELESELAAVRDAVKKAEKERETEAAAAQAARDELERTKAELLQRNQEKAEVEAHAATLESGNEKLHSDLRTAEELGDQARAQHAQEAGVRQDLEEQLRAKSQLDSEAVEQVNTLLESLSQLDYDFIPRTQISSTTEGILALGKVLVEAFNFINELQSTLSQAMDQLENVSTKAAEQEHILSAASAAFGSAAYHQLPMQIASVLSETQALEDQLKEHEKHKVDTIETMERSHQKALAELRDGAEGAKMEAASYKQRYNMMVDKAEDANHRSYNILKIFFRRVSALMGSEYMDRINAELNAIVLKCEATGKSKLPLLTDLMTAYVDELCKLARSPERLPRENQDLREKVRSLESILTEELKHRGADAVMVARYKDLEMRLKDEQEKRRLDYDAYQRKLADLSL